MGGEGGRKNKTKQKEETLEQENPSAFSSLPSSFPVEAAWWLRNAGSDKSPVTAYSPAAAQHHGRPARVIVSGGPWKTTLWLSLHHAVPPMEKIEWEEGV